MWRIDPGVTRDWDPPGLTKILIMTRAPFGQPPSQSPGRSGAVAEQENLANNKL